MENSNAAINSLQNLFFLANELASNYFNASLDTKKEMRNFKDHFLQKEIWEQSLSPSFHSLEISKEQREVGINKKNERGETDDPEAVNSSNELSKYIDITYDTLGNDPHLKRTILVIGAGASVNSFKNIPAADDAVKQIQEKFHIIPEIGLTFNDVAQCARYLDEDLERTTRDYIKKMFKRSDKKIFLEFLEKIESDEVHLMHFSDLVDKYAEVHARLKLYSYKFGNDEIDFETSLVLLAHFYPSHRIREELSALYDYQHGPTLFYGIAAHMLKHRIIDVVINFNFDELLDQYLKDEMGKKGYYSVLSDGDCIDIEDILIEGKLKQPIYIKPHGTVSHKASMRFTKTEYFELPYDMKVFLSDLIACNQDLKKGNGSKVRAKNINLITVGFGMTSLEFNDILRNNLPEQSNIFNFFHSKGSNEEENKQCTHLRASYQEILGNKKARLFLVGSNLPEIPSPHAYLGTIFELLYLKILEHFKGHYRPKNLHYHKLVNKLFTFPKTKKLKKYFKSKHYLKDRTILEIFIKAAQNNGYVSPGNLLRQRVGKYYSACVEKHIQDDPNKNSQLMRYKSKAITDYLHKELDIRQYNDETPIIKDPLFQLKNFDQKDENGQLNKIKLVAYLEKAFDRFASKKFKKLHKEKLNYNDVFQSFVSLFNDKESIIVSGYDSNQYYSFYDYKKSQLLNTNLSFYLCLLKNFKKGLDTILMITDDLFILKKYSGLEEFRNVKNIILILSSTTKLLSNSSKDHKNTYNAKLKNTRKKIKISNEINLNITYLPSHRHNEHMFFFLDSKTFDWKNQNLVYFYKKGSSSAVSPIELNEEINVARSFNSFMIYYARSKRFCGTDKLQDSMDALLTKIKNRQLPAVD